jgi:hypothetical protein
MAGHRFEDALPRWAGHGVSVLKEREIELVQQHRFERRVVGAADIGVRYPAA